MKTTLNRQELVEYIKHATELESSIQRQEECIQLAKSSLSMPAIKRTKVKKPNKPQLRLPKEPERPQEPERHTLLDTIGTAIVGVLVVFVLGGLPALFCGFPLQVLVIIGLAFGIFLGFKTNNDDDIKYATEYDEYRKQHEKWEIEVKEEKRVTRRPKLNLKPLSLNIIQS